MTRVQRLPVSPQPDTTSADPGQNAPESAFFGNPAGDEVVRAGREGAVDGSQGSGGPVESVVEKVLPGEQEASLGREGGGVKSSAAGEGWGDIGESLAQSVFIAGNLV